MHYQRCDIPVAAKLEREMRGMGNLTRAAYANQRMTLLVKLRQSKE